MDDIRRNRERLCSSLDKKPRNIFKSNKRKQTIPNNNEGHKISSQNHSFKKCDKPRKNSNHFRQILCHSQIANKQECDQKISKCRSKQKQNSIYNVSIHKNVCNLGESISKINLYDNENCCLEKRKECPDIEIICKQEGRAKSCKKRRKVIVTKKPRKNKVCYNKKSHENFEAFKDVLIEILDKKCDKKHILVCCTNSEKTPTKKELNLLSSSLNQIKMMNNCGIEDKLVICSKKKTGSFEELLETQKTVSVCNNDSESTYELKTCFNDLEINAEKFPNDFNALKYFNSSFSPCENIPSTETENKSEQKFIDKNWILLKNDHCLENYSDYEAFPSKHSFDETPIQICTM